MLIFARLSARAILFFLLLLFCLTPWASPPVALALGLALALTVGNPFAQSSSKITKLLLQTSVVGLGFGMNLQTVLAAGKSGFFFTLATIAGTLLLGYVAGRAMNIDRGTTHLISPPWRRSSRPPISKSPWRWRPSSSSTRSPSSSSRRSVMPYT
jgi:uncharacterized membrane protein YadS